VPAKSVLVSWSGGKDSCLALERVRRDPGFEVVGLLTTITEEYDRISMHGVRCELLERQAAALGVELFVARMPAGATCERYQAGFAAAVDVVRTRHPELHGIVFGDLFLADIREWRERQLAALGLRPLFPLWGEDTSVLARDFVDRGYQATLVCVDPRQVPAALAGRSFDRSFLADLPLTADPCGERGEFHTFVQGGPAFSQSVQCVPGEVVTRDGFVFADLRPAGRIREGRVASFSP
jgi:uncharacterized protein (TIGR00290 family)